MKGGLYQALLASCRINRQLNGRSIADWPENAGKALGNQEVAFLCGIYAQP
jgi:hypothetical protein